MKRLNLKLVAFLGVGALLFIVGVMVVHGFQVQTTSSTLKDEAAQLEKAGKDDDALRKYIKYLWQSDPTIEEYIHASDLAQKLTVQNQAPTLVTQTYQALAKGLRKYPDDRTLHEAHAKFLTHFIRLGWQAAFSKDLEDELKIIIGYPDHKTDWDVQLVGVLWSQAHYDEALKLAGELVGFDRAHESFDVKTAKAPHDLLAYVELAGILRDDNANFKLPKVADAAMDQMVTVNEKDYDAFLQRAKYNMDLARRGTGTEFKTRRDAAEADIVQAQKLKPDAVEPLDNMAQINLYFKQNREKAKELLEKGLKEHPDHIGFYTQWVDLQLDLGQPQAALGKLKEGLKAKPNDETLLYLLMELQLTLADQEGAQKTIDALEALKFDPTQILLAKATLLKLQGKWLQAAQILDKLRPQFTPERYHDLLIRCDLLAAQCYEKMAEFDKEREACERVLNIAPSHPGAQVFLANAYMATGKRDKAHEIYEGLAKRLGKDKALDIPEIWSPLINLRMDEELKKPAAERDWSRVDLIVKALQSSQKVKPLNVAILTAQVQLKENKPDEARKTLEAVQQLGQDDPSYWSLLATAIVSQEGKGGPDTALRLLDAAPQTVRDSVTWRLTRADVLRKQGAEDVKAKIALLDSGSEKLSAPDRTRLWTGLGANLLQIGDREGAEKYWLRVADLNPDFPNIRFALLELARDASDDVTMGRMHEDLARIVGASSPEAMYADAARKMTQVNKALKARATKEMPAPPPNEQERKTLASARKQMEEVKQARSNWHEAERLMGDIEFTDGNGDAAITHYERSLDLGPPNPVVIRALAILYEQRGQLDKIQQLMSRVGPGNVEGLGLQRIDVMSLVYSKKYDEAIKEAQQLVHDDSRDPFSHIWLANVYTQCKHDEDAEKSLRRAVAVGGEMPEAWLLLIGNLVNRKKTDEAQQVLIEARKKLPDDRVNQMLGRGYESLGQMDAAEQYFKLAVKQAPDDLANRRMLAMFYSRVGRKDDAKAEVIAVLAASKEKPELKRHLQWGRRALADLLAATGEYKDLLTAKSLLIENINSDDDDQDDTLRLANLLAMRSNEPASWREAVEWMDKVRGPLAQRDQLTLAKLHDLTGEWGKAREEMMNLVTQSKPENELYGAFISMLMRHNELADARSWLDRLEQAQPGVGQFMEAKLLVKEGHPAQAVAYVKRLVPARPIPPQKVPLLLAVANVTDQLGLADQAEELYREFATYEPDTGAMPLANFLSKIGKVDEALDVCEKALKTQPAPAVLQLACVALRAQPRKVQSQQIKRVEQWFQQALAKDADSVLLRIQYADFLDIAGKEAESEKEYRNLLARQDVKGVQRAIVLNNLAFLLANQKKNLPEALDMINKSAELIGYNSDVLDSRGVIYLAMDNSKGAIADFQQAVMLPEPSAVKLLHLAYAQDLSGDKKSAQATLQQSKDAQLDTSGLTKIDFEIYERLMRDVGL